MIPLWSPIVYVLFTDDYICTQKQTHLTMTLIMLVMLFVIGEVPMFFSSRTIQTGLVFPEVSKILRRFL